MIYLVHIGEVVVGAHAMFGHHAAHAGAVAAVIILLDPARLARVHLEIIADEFADPRIDLLPEVDVMRIQGVVEVEHPGLDVGKGALGFHHGIANRSVLPPPLMSTAAKPVAPRPRVPQSPCSVISNLLSRVHSRAAPPQFKALSLNLIWRPSASTASAKLKIWRGRPGEV